jgi:hypothetical protein
MLMALSRLAISAGDDGDSAREPPQREFRLRGELLVREEGGRHALAPYSPVSFLL